MHASRWIGIVVLIITVLGWPHKITAQPAPQVQTLDSLWFDVSLGPPLVQWFNQAARPTDIARANDISDLELLNGIQTGRKLMVFKSVRTAEEHLPRMAHQIDIIGYNVEHHPGTPADEQSDPVTGIRDMRALADRYGLQLAVGPDHDFALEYGVAMAPYVDMFILQIQRVQNDPEVVREFVVPMAAQLRQANPELLISVQVRTEGNVPGVVELVDSLRGDIDGLSILTSPETLRVYADLVAALRPSSPQVDLSAPVPSPSDSSSLPADSVNLDWLEQTGIFAAGPFGLGVLIGAAGVTLLLGIAVLAVVMVAIALTLLLVSYHLLARR